MNIQECMSIIKKEIELCISTGTNEGKVFANGSLAKESLIRSSRLIEYLHDCIKYSLIQENIKPENIFPPYGKKYPEIKITGFLKQKDQDITVVPTNIAKESRLVSWGPLKYENIYDYYGQKFASNSLIINVRSQLSSLAKNADTLFERTFAEAINLHTIYKNVVLGEVYLIPVYEYNEIDAKSNKVSFSSRRTNLEKYISFFSAVSGRKNQDDADFKYERCCLLIVDFSKEVPKIYNSTQELKEANIIDQNFELEYRNISFENFSKDIIEIYKERFDINNIQN